jgi:hypothetical protein
MMLGDDGMLGIVRDHTPDDSAMAAEVICQEARGRISLRGEWVADDAYAIIKVSSDQRSAQE